jgi:cyanobactin maturation PatA/PatG family protease
MDEGKYATNPRDLLEFLTAPGDGNLHFASAILWTLNLDATPFYVLHPEGAFARETYARLLEFFRDQVDGKAERVSVPGVLDGIVTLLSGQQVPVVMPDLRAMYNWKTADLIGTVAGQRPESEADGALFDTKVQGMRNFLERIYYELRNLGQTPQERALNFAATNAFNLQRIFESAAKGQLQLDEIGVDQSPLCRPDSDCWDVRLTFFDPANVLTVARTMYRFTVDVSDVVPVLVGPFRSWAVR